MKKLIEREWKFQEKVFFILVLIILLLGSVNLAKARGWLIPEQPRPEIVGKTIKLDALTLEQKIAQMLIVAGGRQNLPAWKNLQVGGIHLFALQDEEVFRSTINEFQKGRAIPFLVTVDLEGCRSPFAHFREFPAAAEISSPGQAFEAGSQQGKFLASLGFSVNFAPVVDLKDTLWQCRSFPGNETEIAELAEAYILGIQKEGIIATAKHYPGKTLVILDPHQFIVSAPIEAKDVYPYRYLAEKAQVKAVMVSHLITSGEVDSRDLPAAASPSVIQNLQQGYSGLTISDEINMLGLRDFYPTLDEMYVAVFKAGNDLILNFNEDPQEIYHLIKVIKQAVLRGEIPPERIDSSVRKILEAKGFKVQ